MIIKIKPGSQPEALAALYNASRPQGQGFIHATPGDMTPAEAAEVISRDSYVDYLKGRVIKTDFDFDEIDPRLFDRDNGEGAAEAALRAAGIVVEPVE